MTDPTDVERALDMAADAFEHRTGEPDFEPGIDSSGDTGDGVVVLQKACRLLASAEQTYESTDFYTSLLEHSFAAIERSLEGYLLVIAGDEPEDLRDHTAPYERARGHTPLEGETIERIEQFYDANRTSYYYGTSVATAQQAKAMFDLATAVHDHVVGFDVELERICVCDR